MNLLACIQRDFGTDYDKIRPHGRWSHFLCLGRDRIQPHRDAWERQSVPSIEQCRRLVDLFVVSVLLDAGAGTKWSYREKSMNEADEGIGRSEGLAVASIEMWESGTFSSDPHEPCRVDCTYYTELAGNMRTAHTSHHSPRTGPSNCAEDSGEDASYRGKSNAGYRRARAIACAARQRVGSTRKCKILWRARWR